QIPSTNEAIAPIGMGTWITFNVGRDPAVRAQRARVLQAFFAAGGGMIDSSPMYGAAQEVLGDLLTDINADKLFTATKVWTRGDGAQQIKEAHQLWQTNQFDLLQIHNLLNWQEHLPLLRDMKSAGKLRYLGVTTSHGRRHAELEKIMKTEALDFVQLTYNAVDREAEQRLLPLAADKEIAVIANRPFQRGALPARLQATPLPAIAVDLGCATWAELLLKFIVSHPAITCAIPATSRVDHMQQNMRAGVGVMPDTRQREQIAHAVASA
ncbi:MAG: aldo/keto reductase, partial [Burkholderiaceae bacterium]